MTAVMDAHGFDRFAEGPMSALLRAGHGPSQSAAGQYFRLLLVGYFEGIDSERGIAWRRRIPWPSPFVRLATQHRHRTLDGVATRPPDRRRNASRGVHVVQQRLSRPDS